MNDEAHGDHTARPSLPPELRDVVPCVRLIAHEDRLGSDDAGAARGLAGSSAPLTDTAG
jgi:hypothetical protein